MIVEIADVDDIGHGFDGPIQIGGV